MTAVAPVKLLPVTAITLPTGPLAGLKVVIVGAANTVKLLAEVAVPPGVVTPILPLLEPLATRAVICVALPTEKLAAAFPPNVTAVAPVKFEPVIVTEVPEAPEIGLKLTIAGAGVTGCELELTPPHAVSASRNAPAKGGPARRQRWIVACNMLQVKDIVDFRRLQRSTLSMPSMFGCNRRA